MGCTLGSRKISIQLKNCFSSCKNSSPYLHLSISWLFLIKFQEIIAHLGCSLWSLLVIIQVLYHFFFSSYGCEVDHGIFLAEWTSAPDSSIAMPTDGSHLVLYVPLHVDNGLTITNSWTLYLWFLEVLSKCIIDLGECLKFLSIVIICDHPSHQMWLLSHLYVSELLDEWNLLSCRPALTPFASNTTELQPAPLNSLPKISDADRVLKYQCLVGWLLYLVIATRPDIAYYAMWLGQFNANPSHMHFLAAKHFLCYLSGTRNLALCLGSPSPHVPSTLQGYLQNVGCSDADWASDAINQKSISRYSFYF